MNKRRAHHLWTRVRAINPWYFLVLAVISGVVCLFALRANNEQMIKLRNAVYTADKNNGDVQGALRDLQTYVTSHMNTSLNTGTSLYPPIQLQYTYQRLQQARADQASQGNAQVYTEAQHYCEQQNPNGFSGRGRVPCIEQYVQSHSSAQPAVIPAAQYEFSFASPSWSPDLAGWSLAAAALSLLLFVVTLIARLWLRHVVA